ncbi:MAG TPA: carboxypeptidase-like regulatory domain-containing protein [Candidatus Sulfotelmatobacter sp.]|nr:carboxypeptidase-like regulatory domain-containing protein [Candidatus Sulfotelmatobacter sp.]
MSSGVAQSNARLWGIVTDPSGAVLAGADVSVHNQATGSEYTAKTNEAGIYQLASLQVGAYRVEVRAHGMQTQTISDLVLQVGENVRRDVSLTVGSTTTTISVSGEAPVIDTSTIEVGQLIDSRQRKRFRSTAGISWI